MVTLTFLGTSDAVPSEKRNHTSILLNYYGENILVDCGEGTQRQMRKAGINPCKLTRVLITHWHGDHVLGLSGLLQTLALSGYNKTLFIYGPRGSKKFVEALFKTFTFTGNLKFEVKEVIGNFFENSDFVLEAAAMNHGTSCNAYSFVLKEKIRIDKSKLEEFKISAGPFLQKLKQGKRIVYKNKSYSAKDLTYKEKERKVSFVFDTKYDKKISSFAKDSDLLVCESTFSSDEENKAMEFKHLTSKQAAEIAKQSKSKHLILTHISQRYSKNPEEILKQAKKYFKNTVIANDFDSFIFS
ncbi:MAG: ribonuclease Z [archaeon]